MALGFHVSKTITIDGKKKTRSMPEALLADMEQLSDWGFETRSAQIFVTGPRNFRETLSDSDKMEIKKFVTQQNIILVIHGAYVDNPWSRSQGSIDNIKMEMKIAAEIGATGVIVHLGAGAQSDESLAFVLGEISGLDKNVKSETILWLEIHTAKSGPFTYETPEKLQKLFDRIKKLNLDLRVGLCIDTAHIYACGLALDTFGTAKKWLDDCDLLLPDIPKMLHLNDSASTLGSGKDKHEILCEGNLWKPYNIKTGALKIENSGLTAILAWAESKNITVILERDDSGINKDLNLINNLGYFQ